MVTADPRTNLVADALRIGALGYMPKPFDFRYLDHLVAMAFEPPPSGREAPSARRPTA
jgi:response regulator of citrate/malate metabolism